MIVAVTGATGYVGRFIVRRLVQEGARVRAWRRPSSDPAGMPDQIEWIEGDLGSEGSAQTLVRSADALVHAALSHAPGRYRGGEGDDPVRFWQLNVDGSAALLRAAQDAGVKRAVVFSTRAVFGRNVKGLIGDECKPSPDTHYGAAKAELEAFIKKFAKDWPACALRPTGVYGMVKPVERSKWFALVGDVLDGASVPARAGTEVHGDDVASATWALLKAAPDKVAGRAFNCSDIVASHRVIVQCVHEVAEMSGPVPEEGEHPQGIMRTDGLARLGVIFGGIGLFKKTIEELVAAARKVRPAASP